MMVLYGKCLDCKYCKFAGGIGFCDREECEFKDDNNNKITTDSGSGEEEVYSQPKSVS